MYKTTRFFVFILFSFFYFSLAQSQDNPSFAGISSGGSFPIGKFRATNLENGSFALTGVNINAEGAWFFKPHLGVGAAVGSNINPIYVSALGWEKVQENFLMLDVTIRSDPFRTFYAMAGLYGQYPVFNTFSVTGKALGGLLYGETPYQLYKPTYVLGGPDFYEITSARDWKFSWQIGTGILYDISPCIGLILEGVLMHDKLSFNFNTSDGNRTDTHTISLINTTLGIRVKF